MLLLQLKSGEYLTIGEEITIQVFRENSSRIREIGRASCRERVSWYV